MTHRHFFLISNADPDASQLKSSAGQWGCNVGWHFCLSRHAVGDTFRPYLLSSQPVLTICKAYSTSFEARDILSCYSDMGPSCEDGTQAGSASLSEVFHLWLWAGDMLPPLLTVMLTCSRRCINMLELSCFWSRLNRSHKLICYADRSPCFRLRTNTFRKHHDAGFMKNRILTAPTSLGEDKLALNYRARCLSVWLFPGDAADVLFIDCQHGYRQLLQKMALSYRALLVTWPKSGLEVKGATPRGKSVPRIRLALR